VALWGRKQTNNGVLLGGTEEAYRLEDLGGRKLKDNTEMGFRAIGWHGVDWIDLAEDRTEWRALLSLRVPYNKGIYSLAKELPAYEEALCYMELSTCSGLAVTYRVFPSTL
jgi:hypothetical protein